MVREILERMTPAGRRMMSISIAAFTIYALASVAMAFVVLAAIYSVLDGPVGPSRPTGWHSSGLLLVKGVSSIVADKQKHCAGFALCLRLGLPSSDG